MDLLLELLLELLLVLLLPLLPYVLFVRSYLKGG